MYQHADVPVMSFPQCRIMISASYRHASSCCPTSLSPVISCHIDVSCPMLVLFPILSHLAHSFDAGIPKQLHHHVLHHTSSCIFPRRTPSFIAPCSLFVLLPSSQSPHLTSSPSYSSPHCTSPLIVPPAIILLIVPVTSSPLPSSPLPSSYPTIACAGGNHSRTSVGHSCAAGSASRNLLCNLFSGSAGVYRPSTDRVVRSHALKHAFSALKHAFFALKHPTARVALANLPCRQVLHAHLNLALSLTLTLISHCYFVVCALTSNVSVPNPNPNPRARCLMLISTATVLKVCSPLANKRCWR